MSSRTPGQRTGLSNTPRNVLRSPDYQLLPGPIHIDATYAIDGANTNRTDELRAGCLMAKITGGLWVPLKLTRVTAGGSGSGSAKSSTLLPVDDARFFKAGDPIGVDSGAALQNAASGAAALLTTSVASVNYTTNIITLDDAADNVSEGAKVYGLGALAGAEICRGILKETIRLRSNQPYETDSDVFDTAGVIIIRGLVDQSQILGDLDAVFAQRTEHEINQIMFDEEQGKA